MPALIDFTPDGVPDLSSTAVGAAMRERRRDRRLEAVTGAFQRGEIRARAGGGWEANVSRPRPEKRRRR